MALKLELRGTSPGRAELSVSGGGTDPGPIEISIQRNQDEHFLSLGGGWQSTPYWHPISEIREQADGLIAILGSDIVDPIVASSGMMFFVGVRSSGVNGQQVLKVAGRLLGSEAAGSGSGAAPPPPPPAPEPAPVETPEPASEPIPESTPEPIPEPVVETVPEPQPMDEGGSSKAGLWIVLVLIALVIAGAAAWYLGLFSDRQPAVVSPPVPATETTPTPVPKPDSVISGRPRAQAFLNRDPAPEAGEMLTQALAWEEEADCEAAMILLNMAAGMDAAASMEMAKRYDPATVRTDGCITTADPETAAYWYERPAEQGDIQAQSRLGILLTERNSSGPLYERGLQYLRDASEAGDNPARDRLRALGE